jgi:hypothetical protein
MQRELNLTGQARKKGSWRAGPAPRVVLAALAALALASCMSPTYYEPASDGEGFTDQQIADNRYRISFAGNSVTARNVVDNYMLYRAAEVTVGSGHDYFVLLEHDVERDVRYHTYVDYPYWPHYWPYYGPGFYGPFYDPFWGGPAEVYATPIERYRAYATIAVYSGTKPDDNPNAYDARDVMSRLAGKVLRPAPN